MHKTQDKQRTKNTTKADDNTGKNANHLIDDHHAAKKKKKRQSDAKTRKKEKKIYRGRATEQPVKYKGVPVISLCVLLGTAIQSLQQD